MPGEPDNLVLVHLREMRAKLDEMHTDLTGMKTRLDAMQKRIDETFETATFGVGFAVMASR